MSHPYTFFQLFRMIVDHSGLTQREIADKSIVHYVTVNRIYTGTDLPLARTLRCIAVFALEQNEQQCDYLEQLRKHQKLTHTTSHTTPAIERPKYATDPVTEEQRLLARQAMESLRTAKTEPLSEPKQKRQFAPLPFENVLKE